MSAHLLEGSRAYPATCWWVVDEILFECQKYKSKKLSYKLPRIIPHYSLIHTCLKSCLHHIKTMLQFGMSCSIRFKNNRYFKNCFNTIKHDLDITFNYFLERRLTQLLKLRQKWPTSENRTTGLYLVACPDIHIKTNIWWTICSKHLFLNCSY